jgi:outer membrane protein
MLDSSFLGRCKSGAAALGVVSMYAVAAVMNPEPARAVDLNDPLNTAAAIAGDTRIAASELNNCRSDAPLPKVLTLMDVVERVVCESPRTTRAWAQVRAQAALLGASRGAYLPTASAYGFAGRANKDASYPDSPQFDSSLHVNTTDVNVSLTWVLYDFGLRAANLDSARRLLEAASAQQDDAFQLTFLEAAQAFYEAQAATVSFGVAQSGEAAAEQSYKVADGLYVADVGPLADKLQAKTAWAQAKSRRVRAYGNLQNALGSVALLMGLSPTHEIQLSPPDDGAADSPLFGNSVEQLIAEAQHNHPRLLAARAAVESARADVGAARARGRPIISFGASSDRSDTPIIEATAPGVVRTNTFGIQIAVPLFDGFVQHYQTRRAQALADQKQADLDEQERRIGLDVWKSYQDLRTAAESLQASASLLESGRQSLDVARGRYRSGVGTLLELLKAQSDLDDAEQEGVSAKLAFQRARLGLASSLGMLGK